MKHKTLQQLRDKINIVLKRARPKQLKKLQKAYHGKRLKKWWSSYASWEWIVVIVLFLVFSIIAKRERKRRYKHFIDKLEENGHYRVAESIKKAMDDGVLK